MSIGGGEGQNERIERIEWFSDPSGMTSLRREDLPFSKVSDESLEEWLPKRKPPFIVEGKVDGEDLVVVKMLSDQTYALNRYGTKYTVEDLPFLTELTYWPTGIIVRGEMYYPFGRNGTRVYDLRRALKADREHIHFAAYDVIYYDGRDIRSKPLSERKKILSGFRFPSPGRAAILPSLGEASTKEQITHLYEQALEKEYEGIVIKPTNSIYKDNAWLKLKKSESCDVLLTAVKDTGRLTVEQIPWSFRMEMFTKSGDRVYVGDVSSGLTFEERAEIWEKVKPHLGEGRRMNGEYYYPFKEPLVAEIRAQEILQTNGGAEYSAPMCDVRFRHPVIVRLRYDKPPEECVLTSGMATCPKCGGKLEPHKKGGLACKPCGLVWWFGMEGNGILCDLKTFGLIMDIRFHGKAGRRSILYTMRRGGNVAYISNFRYWRKLRKRDEDLFFRRVIAGVSHETLHKVLQHMIRYTASNRLDRIHYRYTRGIFTDPEGIALPSSLRV